MAEQVDDAHPHAEVILRRRPAEEIVVGEDTVKSAPKRPVRSERILHSTTEHTMGCGSYPGWPNPLE